MNISTEIISSDEDFSDDFFQSKHINKRMKELIKRERESLSKLQNGLIEIRNNCKDGKWRDDKEHLLLELFSKLHVDKKFYKDEYRYGYHLLDSSNFRKCSYDLKNNVFWISYSSIWIIFEKQFNMNYNDAQSLMNKLLREHFKLYGAAIKSWLWH